MNAHKWLALFAIVLLLGSRPFVAWSQDLDDTLDDLTQDLESSGTSQHLSRSVDASQLAFAAATFALACEMDQKEQYAQALDKFKAVAEVDPSYIPTYTRTALIYLKLNKPGAAIDYLRDKERRFQRSAEIKALLSYLYARQNQMDKAVSYAKKSMQLNPQLITNYQLQARYYLQRNQAEKLSALMASSLAVNSKSADFYLRLGDLWTQIWYQSGPLTEKDVSAKVLPFYQKAEKLAPDNLKLAQRLGQLQFELGDYAKATSYYERVYQKNPRAIGLRENLSICYISLQDESKAIGVLESLLEDYPERKNLYPTIAELYGHQSQWDKAVFYYRMYVQLARPDVQDYVQLADAQMHASQPKDALATLDQAIPLFPEILPLQLYKAMVLRALGRWKDALNLFAQLEQTHNDKLLDSNFYFDYGVTYERSGDESKAIETLRKCLTLNPNNHQALNYLGYMWASKGQNLDEAERCISKALSLDPGNAAYLDSLAWVCYQKKEYQKALNYQQQAIERLPEDPEILEHLADIYYKLGDTEKAIETWSKASTKAKDPELLNAKIQAAREQQQPQQAQSNLKS